MPYYIYGRSAFDALFVFVSNGSVILYNYRTASLIMDSTMIFLISLWSMSSMPGRFRTTSEYLTTYMEGVLLMLCSYFTARTVWSYITIVLYHRWRARPRYSSCRWYRNVRNRNHRYLSVLPHRLYLSICIRSDVERLILWLTALVGLEAIHWSGLVHNQQKRRMFTTKWVWLLWSMSSMPGRFRTSSGCLNTYM